jgi:peroxiredoxin
MGAVLLIVRAGLAAVLGLAGMAKLVDREGGRRAVHEFGVPAWLARPLGLLVPLAELGIAAALVPGASARAAAVAAGALLAIFSVAVASALVRGRRPDCHCFGRLHSAPIGWWTLARNGALAALAVLVVSQPAAGPRWIELAAGGIAALVAGQAWLCLELLRRHGRALRRIEELETGLPAAAPLEIGAEAPPFVLPDLDGRSTSLETLLASWGQTVLLFSDPGCGACDLVLRHVDRFHGAGVIVISSGEPRAVAAKASEYGLDPVLLDERREVAMLYGAAAVPTAVLVDAEGSIASVHASGALEVEELLRRSAASSPVTPLLHIGAPALSEGWAT